VLAIPWAVGEVALGHRASRACQRPHARAGPGALPPSPRLEVLSRATRQPTTSHCPAPRWRLDALGAALVPCRAWPLRRSSLWRMREDADLQPHRRVYGLNRHAPDGDTQAHHLCAFDRRAPRCVAPGRFVLGTEAKTGRPSLERTSPPQPRAPGKPEQRAHAYLRPGTRGLLASCVVPTGQGVGPLGPTRTRAACAAHVAHVVPHLPKRKRDDWGGAHLTTPWRLDVGRGGAQGGTGPFVAQARRRGVPRRACLREPSPQPGLHCTPTPGSGLTQVA